MDDLKGGQEERGKGGEGVRCRNTVLCTDTVPDERMTGTAWSRPSLNVELIRAN